MALVIFSVCNPLRAIFGRVEAIGYRSQALGIAISPCLLRALSYFFTIIVLIPITARSRKKGLGASVKLGLPYSGE